MFIPHGLEKVSDVIARLRPPDFQVMRGAADRLFYLHRVKEGRDMYWVANDSGEAREIVLSLAALGIVSPIVGAVLHNAGEIYVLVNSARLLGFGRSRP